MYRTIWGEYPENREMVMSNRINVATCPSCKKATKVPSALMYTNAQNQFAVWWEPEFDPQIGQDSEGYVQMMGAGNYLAAAPRIQDWEEFKNTIVKFESGVLKAKPGSVSKDMEEQMQGFMKHLKDKDQQKSAGCFGVILLLLVSSLSIGYSLINICFS